MEPCFIYMRKFLINLIKKYNFCLKKFEKIFHLKKISLVQPLFMFIGVVFFYSISQSAYSSPPPCNKVLTPLDASREIERDRDFPPQYKVLEKVFSAILEINPVDSPSGKQRRIKANRTYLNHIVKVLKKNRNLQNLIHTDHNLDGPEQFIFVF